jgi:phosphate:Na+ symporter
LYDVLSGVIQATGGLGLFLLGMSVMTEGLRALADDKLRSLLSRSTKSLGLAVFTGALTTAMVQSSSATTVAAVGFVHAGLLTFSQSLGIIFGANIGTTVTGWMIALVGFKLQLGTIMLPIIFLGALLRVSGRGRLKSAGTALAGFGLIFVGITALQAGLSEFQGLVTPDIFPPDTLLGRLLLILIGILITVITQSSSAGVATAITAIHTGTISLDQGAAMVIGMNLGTTVTAAIATIGGNTQARRTGLAHVFYNCLISIGAFLLLTPYFTILDKLWPNIESTNAEIALVSFHTFFNVLGVVVILPLTDAFARMMERLVPDRGNPLTKRLDRSLVSSPEIALQAVSRTLQEITHSILSLLAPALAVHPQPIDMDKLDAVDDAIDKTRDYLEGLRVDPERDEQFTGYSNSIHVLDHLQRISRRAHDQVRLSRARDDTELSKMADLLLNSIALLSSAEFPIDEDTETEIHKLNGQLKSAMRDYRIRTLRLTAAGEMPTLTVLQRMDAARCLRRIGYHIWRIADHGSDRPTSRTTKAASSD